jgi:predicted  nucleic acid-binding Zn-ribbon protein
MELLVTLQKLALAAKPLTLKDEAEILELRRKIPAPILDHFDRLVARGKKGVAIARNGACSECHLRLPSGTMASLAYTDEVHLCDNCGRYLYLPAEPALAAAAVPLPVVPMAKTRTKRVPKKAAAHAA